MPSEILKRQIKTTDDLREIVSNMKALSSVSIIQYENANAILEKYQRNLRDAFHVFTLKYGIPPQPKTVEERAKILMILIGTDNGMVGGFNREIIEQVRSYMLEHKLGKADVYAVTVGKRLSVMAEKAGLNILSGYGISNAVKYVVPLAESIILKIDEALRKYQISKVMILGHKRKNSAAVTSEWYNLLPFDYKLLQRLKNKKWETNNIPMLPLSEKQMFSALINESLMIVMAKALNSSLAAEHFTRMTNMQNAEKNIYENLEKLNIRYQQQRQEEITSELIDIVSGSEAMSTT